ncbi:UDP-N-acetylglucosamine--N-acetylmuramyl-(pentapeptide) pyrophosphoryl-undecaprenol N-acetylglucosamine transferase [Coriobacterium glomerans PW2]|uniref:UDP-N-acetylglucosamine--N-acetylmuramyl-(pentapeptide) pyrophosphoryl-undecaprenol N-acetylglucosamine transferase n=1 Tax=Coriobacterium glomerans (strain ATCC 49209 / DSM 20642 / JCM 10262 / PW2) TaxID=700015 RepID=F2NBR6_CORGP|nr:UDP-N-acetylglucosamine--N-acetylmuramyl-(pentapeptide) pyrophosphoryl-undecaprenol N-acetylglucosamine transferase [Coriobacterium glomerans]AEB06875.1 UDP-N-acetylglucosamine--N-acetylmuramyl-(pentapeptide) pyrophosphoryl-undecaprenol N-acetylglucosamine transferase [Coriobacterium glomerans PW2]
MIDRPAIAIAAGGTAGHVNPALALAEELRRRGATVRFFGERRRLEGRLVPQAGFDLFPIHMSGFDRQRPWTLASALARLRRERRRICKAFRDDPMMRPDVAMGFGAYVELPLLRAALDLGIPVALHEQNSIPGLANKRLASRAGLIAVSLPSAQSALERAGANSSAIRLTGNPVRASVLSGDRSRGRAAAGAQADDTVLLVFGGSLGAHHLNEAIARLKGTLLGIEGVRIVHATGAADYEATSALLDLSEDERQRYRVTSYIDDMGDMLAAADVVLSRAGASSIAEIAAAAVPSILVPYPLATRDHQTTNARYLVDAGAAIMCADDEIDSEGFASRLIGLLGDSDLRRRMHLRGLGLGQADAAGRLADAVLALVV